MVVTLGDQKTLGNATLVAIYVLIVLDQESIDAQPEILEVSTFFALHVLDLSKVEKTHVGIACQLYVTC